MRRWAAIAAFLLAGVAQGALVHVYQETLVGGVRTQLSDETKETGETYTTQTAPAQSGYIFTHWSISTTQSFTSRDRLGRALDAAPYKLYEETTLTANYLPSGEDSDNDGVADGWEIYWYGDLSKNADSDTDGDSYTFAQELAAGTDPLMMDESLAGGIAWADCDLLQYNPFNLQSYTIRSEPEGQLFATQSDYVEPGTLVETSSYSPSSSMFAYWTVNGVRQADRLGRAKDSVSVVMPSNSLEIVAVCESDSDRRMGLYWYGTAMAMDSDTDGDGYTFAQELAAGTDPLMADESLAGGIVWADGDLLQYNPYNLQSYTIRSEPEGALFATQTDYATPGTVLTTPTCNASSTTFAYWTLNGVRQQDRLGRALDVLSFAMPSNAVEAVAISESDTQRCMGLYWYGNAGMSAESDTDGDGYTFAQELAAGTDPLMADESLAGGIVWADGELLETNLQPYEQIQGTVVDDAYAELFSSPTAGTTGVNFGTNAAPHIVDVNGDGKWDLVVVSGSGVRVMLNIGTAGNPMFHEVSAASVALGALGGDDLSALEDLTFDTPPINPVSFTFADVDGDGVEDLLVADVDGRIWYYRGTGNGERGTEYVLQHKVWGGSFGGFAPGLRIAAVDWDEDGDIDLVCGTADGRLMLLNDPRTGRPVNVRAEAGATSVVLMWDPNVNSRVRGYGIYRSADSNNYAKIENLWPLPRYRDTPPTLDDQWYRVTGKSRFYVTGNSTPIETESLPTDAVFVQFRPTVWLNDTSSFTDTNVEVVVSMNNSMGLRAEGFSMTFTYDPNVLEPVEMKTTGLSGEMMLSASGSNGTWTLTGTGGTVGIGAGRFVRLVFYVKPVHDVTETTVTLTAANVNAEDGHAVPIELPKSAKIEISDANPIQPALVSLSVDNAAVDTCKVFELPVTVTSSEILTNGTFTVEYNPMALEWNGTNGTSGTAGTVMVSATGDFALTFLAKDQHDISSTQVRVIAATVVDEHGFTVVPETPVSGTVLIHDAHPLVPAVVSISMEDRKVDTLEEVTIPFRITSSEILTNGTFTVEYDPMALEWNGANGTSGAAGTVIVSATGDFALTFLAKDQHDISSTQVRVVAATVADEHGFTVNPTVPVVGTILIHDAHPLMPAVVSMTLGDVAAQTESEFDMTLAISSTEALTSLRMNLAYDAALLELRSGVLEYSGTVPSSVTLRFYAKENHTVDSTTVTVTPVSATDHNGFTSEITLPASVSGTVILADSNPWQPATVAVGVGGAKIDTRTEFAVPVTLTSNETLTNFAATVSWNTAALELRGASGVELRRVGDDAPYQAGDGSPCRIVGAGADFTLTFYAKDQHDITSAGVTLYGMSAVDNHGLTANAIADATGTVLIHDAHPLMPAVVSMTLGDVAAQTEGEFDMTLAIASTEALTALRVNLAYDTSLLELRSGVLEYSGTVPSSVTLRFYAKENHTVDSTTVTVTPVSAADHNGFTSEITLPASVSGTVILADSNPWQPATVAVGVGGAKIDTRTEFAVPVTLTSNETLTNFAATVSWNTAALELRGASGVELRRVGDDAPYQAGDGSPCRIVGAGADFTLTFYAKDQHDITSAGVTLYGMSAVDNHGLTANAIADATGTVLIHDAHPLIPAEVAVKAGDVSSKTLASFSVPVAVTTTKPLTNLTFGVSYDASVLEYRGCVGAAWADGVVTAKGAVPDTILLTFYAKDQHAVTQTAIAFSDGAAVCTDALAANVTLANGTVSLTDSNPPVPVKMAVSVLDARAEAGKSFVLLLGSTTDGDLSNLVATVKWDANRLTFNGADTATSVSTSATSSTLGFVASGTLNRYNLNFTAKALPSGVLQTNTTVRLTAASGTGANGLAAQVTTALPAKATVIIVRNIGKYDPGDINGDGKYTDADMTLLQNYVKYLSIVSAAPQLASRYASWKLTGKALKASDANGDGKVDANDISMLAQLIAQYKEMNQ